MLEQTDAQLLRDYAEHRNEAAFRELVSRHADVVYASALRQVSSPDLAQDIAQSVFTDLARKAQPLAATLTGETSLLGWLFRSTRFLVLNQLRHDRRRQARERQAMENFNPISEPAREWECVQPVLDEAMADLSNEDRDALLLRFFKNHNFRAIGAAFGVSDDAAQKRVSRALERLRIQLTSRGVTTTAVALSTALSTNAVPLAPAGLAATLSTAALAGTTFATAATTTALKTIVMTTFQKTLITATIAVAVGAGIYEARQASNLRDQVQSLQQYQTRLTAQLQQQLQDTTSQMTSLIEENEQLKSKHNTMELLKLRGEVTRLRKDASDPNDALAKALVAKVNKLKQRLEETPGASVPELRLLTEEDWFEVANTKLDTDVDYRRALASLRGAADSKFASILHSALSQYLQASNGQFPSDLAQLQSYFTSVADGRMLQRWEITTPKTVSNVGVGVDAIITQKVPVDDVFDTRMAIGSRGYGSVDFLSTQTQDLLAPVYDAFAAAKGGQKPAEISQMLPYATTPEQQAAIEKLMFRSSSTK